MSRSVQVSNVLVKPDNRPYINIGIEGAVAQIDTAEARDLALEILDHISRAEASAALVKSLDRERLFHEGSGEFYGKEEFRDFFSTLGRCPMLDSSHLTKSGDIVIEGPKIEEFVDLMAKVPIFSIFSDMDLDGIRNATRIVGRRGAMPGWIDWYYEFRTPSGS